MTVNDSENAHQGFHTPKATPGGIEPFALLGKVFDVESFRQEIANHYTLETTAIHDAYPCTPRQESLMSSKSKRPGDFIRQNVLELAHSVVVKDICTAFEQLSRATPILRTRLVEYESFGLLQVVLDEEIGWIEADSLDGYLEADKEQSMHLGQPLTRYALIKDAGTPRWLIWTIHDAICDNWSVRLIMDSLNQIYRSGSVKNGSQFQAYINYIKNQGREGLVSYWKHALADCKPSSFPSVSTSLDQPVADEVTQHHFLLPHRHSNGITTSNLIRASWALVAGRMINSEDVVFGATLSGRNAPVVGIEGMIAPTATTVPVCIKWAKTQRVSEYLQRVQQQSTDMIPFEHVGLQHISKICPGASQACAIQTNLIIQSEKAPVTQDAIGKWRINNQGRLFTSYGLTIEIQLEADNITASAFFDPRMIVPWVVRKLLKRLEFVMHQLDHASPDQVLAEIGMSNPEDLGEIWEWNSVVPVSSEKHVQEMITERSRAQPGAPAVCAWDGELTYDELERLAIRLANRLTNLGIKPGVLVPLCFEKSMWTTVAILGVLKTGAAFLLLDSSQPKQRLHGITQQAKAHFILSSRSNYLLSLELASEVIIVDPHFFTASGDQPDLQPDMQPCLPSPSAPMYVVFTSGSTGTPKGTVITHRNMSSALYYQQRMLGFTATSRVFDFSSYSFDASIYNVFATLTAGGCLCVPDEKSRLDNPEKAITLLDANSMILTPSVARVLAPERMAKVQTIMFIGEALHVRDVCAWWGKARTINLYGPCECTPISTVNDKPARLVDATHIGKGVGVLCWVVDSDDHDSLLPPGCIGELLLEGPLVGDGYLNDSERTAAAFIDDPTWLLRGAPGRPGRSGRLYKTGDLVRYNEDGSLTFVGRKDTQVKIRGQRVELGEIEHVLRSHESVTDAAAILKHQDNQETLVAGFVTLQDGAAAVAEQPRNSEEMEHVDVRKKQWDAEYAPINNISSETIGRDFIGWTSMYDGSDIDKGEMNEWLDDTLEAIRNGCPPEDVLEIGTGSGMILFNLAQGLRSYFGLEPSRRAVDFIVNGASSVPALADKVRMLNATAADLVQLHNLISPKLVVLNSVVQYFPSQTYLFRVIQDLLRFEGVKTLFFGDIRSYPLHKEFLVARALKVSGANATKDEIRRIVTDMERAESELLIDPAFFTALPSQFPGRVQHVEILPKRVHATNELSCFRYAAVVHVRTHNTQKHLQIQETIDNEWIDFVEQGLDHQSLRQILQGPSTSSIVAISNIPNSKIAIERNVVEALATRAQGVENSDQHWLSSVHKSAHDRPSLSTMDLVELARQAGYRVEISWARQASGRGALDAIFHRHLPKHGTSRVLFRFPVENHGRPYHSLTSQPLQEQVRRKIIDELNDALQAKLPSYMVPRMVTVLDRMPVNASGKIDRRALPTSFQTQISGLKSIQQPTTLAESKVQKIWGNVLNIEPATIGLDDSFFQLGGNSITAMKAIAEARQVGLEMTVANIFRHPKLRDIVTQTCSSG
ncbi:hypothetical protein QQS21_002030 [Conoideocrella luteorostrata]|uniref:Carrier domain-containing protein n=1 Tax=Conoideocrella luteorostrata TaxID=1105319 RepID=A0AAJ0G1L5_9HYPO|nr:hypothetical protein QQS21_002030 [Conoideocrella luteorostrata]